MGLRDARESGPAAATPSQGLGCLPWSGHYGPVDTRELGRTLRYALDVGITFLDLADFTADGIGLRRVGRALGARRAEAVVAVHVGWGGRGSEPADLPAQYDEALSRAGLDYADLCCLHVADDDVPVEERIGALAPAVHDGRARGLGLCAADAALLVRAHKAHPITTVSTEYSLWNRRAEAGTLPAARELGITVVACQPLAGGLLTGRPTASGASVRPREQHALRRLQRIASDLDLSTGRLALAWLLSRGEDVVPVPGSTDSVHVEMNVSAVDTRLPSGVIALLDREFPIGDPP